MNTPGQLSRRVEELEQGKDGARKDLIISWEDNEPFLIIHMQGSRYIGQSDPEEAHGSL
jgi:hypothetical protein